MLLTMLLKERERVSFSSKRGGELEGGAYSRRGAQKQGHGSAVFPVATKQAEMQMDWIELGPGYKIDGHG